MKLVIMELDRQGQLAAAENLENKPHDLETRQTTKLMKTGTAQSTSAEKTGSRKGLRSGVHEQP